MIWTPLMLALVLASLAGAPDIVVAQATRFEVRVPASTPPDAAVYLAGDAPQLGGWAPAGLKLARQHDGSYTVDVDLPPGSTAEFKVTRGAWETVEKSAEGEEIANRTVSAGQTVRVEVAAWADGFAGEGAATTRTASTVMGDLRVHEKFASKHLGNERTVRVWLPPGYEDGEARYPVLYLHDGQNLFDATTGFAGEWQADETATRLIAERAIRPVILVGIDNAGAARLTEYGPTTPGGPGRGDDYLAFLADEVKPFVDVNYRTLPGRDDTFVAGSSMGGLISLEAIRKRSTVFGGALVMSPALWWDDATLARTLQSSPNPLPGAPPVFLSMGTREGARFEAEVARTRQLGEKLTGALPPGRVRVEIVENGAHNEAAWAALLPEALRFLLPPDAPPLPITRPSGR